MVIKRLMYLILILLSINTSICGIRDPQLLTLRNWIFVLKITKKDVLDNKIIIPLPSSLKIKDAFIYLHGLIKYKCSDSKRVNTQLFNKILDRLNLKYSELIPHGKSYRYVC